MKKSHHYIYFLLATTIVGLSCAVIKMPTGGPPDETGPVVITGGASTPNKQVFFDEREIVLEFNEWIKVSNTAKEIFVSPPLDYPLQVSDRGKKVILEFNEKEVLKENTTYQISMGKAIKDLTAGNEMEDYTFLFSTGAQLDELSISGSVIDEITQKPQRDIVVVLYDNLSDTAFTTTKPFYLTRTDKEGAFTLQNLRSDTFQIFALKDDNVSYTYDQPGEMVGYIDSFLVLMPEDSISGITLELFDEEDDPLLVEAREYHNGLIKVTYLPVPRNPNIRFLDEDLEPGLMEIKNDTIFYWHKEVAADSLMIEISFDGRADTTKVRRGKKTMNEVMLEPKTRTLDIEKNDTIFLEWNKPLVMDNKEAIRSCLRISDTSGVRLIKEVGIDQRRLWVLSDSLKHKHRYSLNMDSACIYDWYDQHNLDSVAVSISTIDPETLGTINLEIEKTDSLSYIMEILSGKDVIDKRYIAEPEKITLLKMKSGKYSVKLTQDSNGDGRWTSGNLKEKRRSEKTKSVDLEPLKAGWELEATINITETFDATQSN